MPPLGRAQRARGRGRGSQRRPGNRSSDQSWGYGEDYTGSDHDEQDAPEAYDSRASSDGRDLEANSRIAWIVQTFGGHKIDWVKHAVDQNWYEDFRSWVHSKTQVDIAWGVAAITVLYFGQSVLNSGVPRAIGQSIRNRTTSSVTIDARIHFKTAKAVHSWLDSRSVSNSTSWFTLRGQHTELNHKHRYQGVTDGSGRFFWFERRLFLLESDCNFEDSQNGTYADGQLVIRCIGRTEEPIRRLVRHCYESEVEDSRVSMITHCAGEGMSKTMMIEKRRLETIDMEPSQKEMIKNDIDQYFDQGSRGFYRSIGKPLRRGWLLYGPPGTGKTSLALAVATHANATLVNIKLSGMDDKKLQEVFHGLPKERCIVLIEDIDATGIVGRGHVSQIKTKTQTETHPNANYGTLHLLEADRELLRSIVKEEIAAETVRQQNVMNQQLLSQLLISSNRPSHHNDNLEEDTRSNIDGEETTGQQRPVRSESRGGITLAGLLNVLDGVGAAEGRLLILTTNAPRSLDPAIYRHGRVDLRIEMGYSTKQTAEMTFKRMFGGDPARRHTTEAIERYARLFAQQFPRKTEMTPATLAEYCLVHRGEPRKAVEEFAEFLRKRQNGEDGFAYDINDVLRPDDHLDKVEDYDQEALQLSEEDLLDVIRSSQSNSTQRLGVTQPSDSAPTRFSSQDQGDGTNGCKRRLSNLAWWKKTPDNRFPAVTGENTFDYDILSYRHDTAISRAQSRGLLPPEPDESLEEVYPGFFWL